MIFRPARDFYIFSVGAVFQFFLCLLSAGSEDTSVVWDRDMVSLCLFENALMENDGLFCLCYEIPLRAEVCFEALMPVDVIGLKIGKDRIVWTKFSQGMRHKARDFDDNNSFFYTFLEDLSDYV